MPQESYSILAEVALLSPPFSTLTYGLPAWLPEDAWQEGLRVAVPLGGRGVRAGVVVRLIPVEDEKDQGEKGFTVKPLLWPLERKPILTASYLEMARQLALRHTTGIGEILGNVLPAGLRSVKARIRFLGAGKPKEYRVSELAGKNERELAELGTLWTSGRAAIQSGALNGKSNELCVLAADPPWPVKPAAKQQQGLLEYLFTHGATPRYKVLQNLGKNIAPILSKLVERELVRLLPQDTLEVPVDESELDLDALGDDTESGFFVLSAKEAVLAEKASRLPHVVLTVAQQKVLDELSVKLQAKEAGSELLFGITGSGKTAVYMELARKAMEAGRSVLLLAPEVALAFKLWGDAGRYLPEAERVLSHGYQPAGVREKTFRESAASAGPRLLIGTRSALFLPQENVGLIILDEEHDSSFKQDEGLSYQAKELAWFRARQNGALLLLGSATPDIKTFHAAKEGGVGLHILSERVGGGRLPQIDFIHLPKTGPTEQLLTQESVDALREVVSRGEQAVILLNRRGYAPLLYCLGCGKVAKCPQCDIGLAYHKGRERLLCHFCGWNTHFPCECAECGSLQFLPMGEGTEKLEEFLSTQFPAGTGILRLDRDSTRRPGRMEEILDSFARKEAQVLVGTQMLSKGHHFPDVTLAVVADADLGLNLPDYRAAERTFQLLMQSAGRSGRGEKPGRVLVQTREPSHYCWQYVQKADYAGFYEQELSLRERRKYPPFVRLALIRISFPMDYENGSEELSALARVVKSRGKELGLTVLGPAMAPLPFLKGRKRFHCLVKGREWQEIRTLYNAVLKEKRRGPLRIRLDLDPVNML